MLDRLQRRLFPSIQSLRRALRSDDSRVAEEAAWRLATRPPAQSVPILVEALYRPLPTQVAEAVEAGLINYGDLALRPIMSVVVDREAHPTVRESAARILCEIGDPRAAEVLGPALSVAREGERDWIALALGRIGDARARSHLDQLRVGSNGYLAELADNTLRRMS